ncbi:unnamed protein product [Linum trigynum]|uniref:BTB domain-containing protein n=1 Tax=Linum trigynum TaxID=586398 RepID=A0AAV2CHP6_9ROSI
MEETHVLAHKVILQGSGNFPFSKSDEDVIQLQSVSYPVLQSLLQYIYTGRTQILESHIELLMALSLKFEVMPLAKQCEENLERCKLNKKLFGYGKSVALLYPYSRPHSCTMFPARLLVNQKRLSELHSAGKYSDLNIYIEGYGLVAQSHKIIVNLWCVPFAKMFTNGMSESISSRVHLRDVLLEAFKIMLEFMYSGDLNLEDTADSGTLLLQLLLLAGQFRVIILYQECCKTLLECLSEDAVCPILQVVSSISSCKLIEETCKRKFTMQFDYCTTTNLDFILLDEATFSNIIQHQDLTVTSEERVVNAILMWCLQAKELCVWEAVDELVAIKTLELLFGERLQSLNELLPFVRFPLLTHNLLKRLDQSNLCKQIDIFHDLVREAVTYLDFGLTNNYGGNDMNLRFQHRRSSYKELQYICDGDSNGVLYLAGTSYGQHQWVNPVLSKRIDITASCPTSRYTDPEALASRTYQGM